MEPGPKGARRRATTRSRVVDRVDPPEVEARGAPPEHTGVRGQHNQGVPQAPTQDLLFLKVTLRCPHVHLRAIFVGSYTRLTNFYLKK